MRRSWANRTSYGGSFKLILPLEALLAATVLVVSAAAFVSAGAWPDEARALPQIVAVMGMLTASEVLVTTCIRRSQVTSVPSDSGDTSERVAVANEKEDMHYDLTTDFGDLPRKEIGLRALGFFALCCIFGLLAWTGGVLAAVPLFLIVYMLAWGERLALAVPIAIIYATGAYYLFGMGLKLAWPVPILDFTALIME